MWAAHARELARRYRVVAVDLPGHGAMIGERFSPEGVAAFLDRVIGEACERPPLLVGYSLGGYVAMDYAARRPEGTAGLLLDGCTLDMDGWKHWPPELGAHLAGFVPPPVMERLIRTTVYMTLPGELGRVVNGIPFDYRVLKETTKMTRTTRFVDRIAGYRKPVLFANGEYDLVFRMDEQRFMRRLPQAELRVIRRADHTAPLRAAQEFTAIVGGFAGRVFAAG